MSFRRKRKISTYILSVATLRVASRSPSKKYLFLNYEFLRFLQKLSMTKKGLRYFATLRNNKYFIQNQCLFKIKPLKIQFKL
ncbi:hypothetical protein DMC01_04855 [Campylobacter troglodytis]|nr:hypothetical protein DMC01_04855 [Campylobacter troglodytis]